MEHIPKNNLYTKSYAVKRLRESGFDIQLLDIVYKKEARYWTCIINPNTHNIFITCYLNKLNKSDFFFKFYSSLNTINIKTKSMLVLIEGINNLITEIDNKGKKNEKQI